MTALQEPAKNSNGTGRATFNLKAVVQETGLKPDTLRAWERRYGVPNPARTAGGHRLYSRYDIHLLKWLVARQEEGLSISRAVDLWRRLLSESKDPFVERPVELEEVQVINNKILVGDTLTEMRERWMAACLAFQEQSAESILNQALSMYSPETVCFELLQHALAQVGHDWYDGKITIQQEHFASALARRRIEALLVGTPPPTRAVRVLVTCAPQEEHTFSVMLLTLLMRRRGWDALYLGANVPTVRLEATLAMVEPKIVIVTAQTLYTAATLLPMAEFLNQKGMTVAFGGLIFCQQPSIIQHIPGHYLGDKLEEAPKMLEQIVNTARSFGHVAPVSTIYHETLQYYIAQKPKLEVAVWERMSESGIRPNALDQANNHLGKHITAALTLGDITLLGTSLNWIEELLVMYHHPLAKESLFPYLKAYVEAATQMLDERGKIIVNWLNTMLDNAANRS